MAKKLVSPARKCWYACIWYTWMYTLLYIYTFAYRYYKFADPQKKRDTVPEEYVRLTMIRMTAVPYVGNNGGKTSFHHIKNWCFPRDNVLRICSLCGGSREDGGKAVEMEWLPGALMTMNKQVKNWDGSELRKWWKDIINAIRMDRLRAELPTPAFKYLATTIAQRGCNREADEKTEKHEINGKS